MLIRNSIDLIMLAADTNLVGALSIIKSRALDTIRARFGTDLGCLLLAHQQPQTGMLDHLRQRFARVLAAVAPGKFAEVLRASQDAGFEWQPDARSAPYIGDLWLTGLIQVPDEMKPRLAPIVDDLQAHVIAIARQMQAQQRRGPRR